MTRESLLFIEYWTLLDSVDKQRFLTGRFAESEQINS